ncbi:MAG: reductive dehalogenase [Dehalogenimonas sp.]
MSKFHSTVSRRDFMRGLGLAGAGLGAASLSAPVFQDLDEVVASTNADKRFRPWYVKELEAEKPTVEIDWQLSHRSDRTKYFAAAANFTSTVSTTQNILDVLPPDVNPAIREGLSIWPKAQWDYIQKIFPNWKGNTVRDYAMESASSSLAFYDFHTYGGYRGYNAAKHKSSSFTGLETAMTPEELGMAKWQGTPEENLKMVRAAARTFGCEEVGVVELTSNTRKLINANSTRGKPINFENVDKASDGTDKTVIPEKCKYMIVYTNLQPTHLTKRTPSQVGLSANKNSYTRMPIQRVQMQEFLRGLGYQGLQVDGMTQSNPWGTLAGIGEHGREAMNLVSPFYGAMYRGIQRMITDLPLATTQPIDAGVFKFCISCKKCSELCPYGSMPMGDPMWEHEDPVEAGENNVIDGHVYKGWRLYNYKCPRCQACQGTCVFSKISDGSIHEVIRGTVATTSVFNGFFRNMDDLFDYGTLKDPETWWDMEEQPVWGIAPALWTKV